MVFFTSIHGTGTILYVGEGAKGFSSKEYQIAWYVTYVPGNVFLTLFNRPDSPVLDPSILPEPVFVNL